MKSENEKWNPSNRDLAKWKLTSGKFIKGDEKMKLTLEEKVIILNKTVDSITERNKKGNPYFIEGFKFGVTMAIKIFLEQELD